MERRPVKHEIGKEVYFIEGISRDGGPIPTMWFIARGTVSGISEKPNVACVSCGFPDFDHTVDRLHAAVMGEDGKVAWEPNPATEEHVHYAGHHLITSFDEACERWTEATAAISH